LAPSQGSQIFLCTICQRGEKCTKFLQNIPKVHKIYQIAENGPNIQKNTYTKSSISRPSKNYPNCDFWSENIPSGKRAPRPIKKTSLWRKELLK
jgi:hypothetical protein